MPNKPTGKQRQFKLEDWEVENLDRIAEVRGLLHGGVPSRSDAIRYLIREEIKRLIQVSIDD